MNNSRQASGVVAALFLAACVGAVGSAHAAPQYRIIYNFSGGPDGSSPSDLVRGPSGSLFGIENLSSFTRQGIFELDPPLFGRTQWHYSLIYSQATNTSLGNIVPQLVFDHAGNLYFGTAVANADVNSHHFTGSVFRLTPPAVSQNAWTATRFAHHFSPSYPNNLGFALSYVDSSGVLFGYDYLGYGPTLAPSSSDYPYTGAVFKVSPPRADAPNGVTSALAVFPKDSSIEGTAVSSLALGADGSFYGTTAEVGPESQTNVGTVFRLTPPQAGQTQWTRDNIAIFKGAKNFPSALTLDRHLTIYGVAAQGGASANGSVFRLTPPVTGQTNWQTSLLYDFRNYPDGDYPSYPLLNHDGVLYGVTFSGGPKGNTCFPLCGTLYKLTAPSSGPQATPWIKHLVHAFGDNPLDGFYPGRLVAATLTDGTFALFGSTGTGGNLRGSNGGGTVYEVIP